MVCVYALFDESFILQLYADIVCEYAENTIPYTLRLIHTYT